MWNNPIGNNNGNEIITHNKNYIALLIKTGNSYKNGNDHVNILIWKKGKKIDDLNHIKQQRINEERTNSHESDEEELDFSAPIFAQIGRDEILENIDDNLDNNRMEY